MTQHCRPTHLCVSVHAVRRPTARFHLIGVQPPELQLLFEQRTANVNWIMQFTGAIVIQDLGEHTRMTIKEVLVQNGIIISQSLGQT